MFQFATLYAKARDEETDFYFQDPKYFDKYRDEIRKLYGKGISENNFVAIHVRRGDYVNNPFYVDLSTTDYYQKAMAEFPDDNFMIFTDDIDFCIDYFQGDRFQMNYESEIDALNTMASCKGIIMANSSFSWWAAYLSKAKVIAPKAWYADGLERTKLLPEWKTI